MLVLFNSIFQIILMTFLHLQIASHFYHQLVDSKKLNQESLQLESELGRKLLQPTESRLNGFVAKHNLGVYRQPQVYKPLVILFFLFFLQQMTGCYVLTFYAINFFRNLGGTFSQKIDENLALILLGILRFAMSIVASG